MMRMITIMIRICIWLIVKLVHSCNHYRSNSHDLTVVGFMDSSPKLTTIAFAIICTLYGGCAAAQQQKEQVHKETEQSEPEIVIVTGTALTIDRLELEQAPKDNPSLSQVLKHEPRVGINDAQGSMQGGDLKPEEISLSGARPHQTKYTIDGVGVNNSTTFGNSNDLPTELTSGHTSGYFVDTNLIDSVEVLDHNIDAEHGGFTGGVINAELRKPTDDFVIDYNFRVNDSDWNEPQKVGESFQDSTVRQLMAQVSINPTSKNACMLFT